MELRGHEFHYSNVVAPDAMPSVAKQFTARGMEVSTPLYRYKNVIAGYTHLYSGGNGYLEIMESMKRIYTRTGDKGMTGIHGGEQGF